MQTAKYPRDRVEPLLARRNNRFRAEHIQQPTIHTDNNNHYHHRDVTYDQNDLHSPRARFQNYLRATYPFHPEQATVANTVTLPFAAGDIILVHSIHTNGWADGTVLENGARGWLPTNYCEPYDYAMMRPLLRALTDLWDVVRLNENQTVLEVHNNLDNMRGVVAGIRYLLDKTDCLTRDSLNVKRYGSLRKLRKRLLADLSILVKACKALSHYEHTAIDEMDHVLDDLMLKAFQVVTRGAYFFDTWSDEVALVPSLTPTGTSPLFPLSPLQTEIMRASATQDMTMHASRHDSPRSTRTRESAVQARPSMLTHRMSYIGPSVHQAQRANLASEQLSDTYDAFLGVLASFLGSHMQSRSSSELLLTTQQAVKSCRRLLEVVEIVLAHDHGHFAQDLRRSKDEMYDNISYLVDATRAVFRPLHSEDDELPCGPGDGAQLVNAATACVSDAGRCVAKARLILEDIGDFELESSDDRDTTPSSCQSPLSLRGSTTGSSSLRKSMVLPDWLTTASSSQVAISGGTSLHTDDTASDHPNGSTTAWTPHTEADSAMTMLSPTSLSSSQLTQDDTQALTGRQKSFGESFSHGSESTLVSSVRDSAPSFVSETSTRATSPDIHPDSSPKLATDDENLGEDVVLEQSYGHELMLNQEGRILGGSLNAIVEKLTSYSTTPEPSFVTMVYLTFRSFASPQQFVQALSHRFDHVSSTPRVSGPVRHRVANTLKGWLESHWRHDCDAPVIPAISLLITEKIMRHSPVTAKRLFDLLNIVVASRGPAVPRLLSSIGKTATVSVVRPELDTSPHMPTISKAQSSALKMWRMSGTAQASITDFDPLEIAQQFTIKTSAIFCSISPEELLGNEFQKKSGSLAVNVRAMSTLSTDLANLVTESVLQMADPKRRAAVIKHWIKIARKCVDLHNYDTLMAIHASINSSMILRLKKTWDLISPKTRSIFDDLTKIVEPSKNFSTLRQVVNDSLPPCLPYVGMYLTDLTFIDHGNPATRELKNGNETTTIINLDKHMKTAKVISELQRFQIACKLPPVDELQAWIHSELARVRANGEQSFQAQYRRSLLLEPRDQQQAAVQRPKIHAFASMSNLGSKDFLAWTHTNRTNGHTAKGRGRQSSISS